MAKRMSLDSVLSIFVARDLGERDLSVDMLRGLAVIGMILVNHAPPTPDVYAFLLHAPWLGWTFADMIFPAFLFLVGVSVSYSQGKESGNTKVVPYARIFRRVVLLMAINVVLVNFPYYEFETLVLHGTLTRIAYCYLVAALICSHFGWRAQLGIVIGILALQWWFLMQYDVPEFGHGVITVDGNASNYLDRMIFGEFVDRLLLNGSVVQGLLPAAGSIASALIGVLSGRWIRSCSSKESKIAGLFAAGLILIIVGSMWSGSYPINKQLWTGSYVLLMGGFSLQLLALFDWLSRFRRLRVAGKFLEVAGVNALFFYVFAQSFQRLLVYGRVSNPDGTSTRYKYVIYENWVEPWIDGKAGALIYALTFLAICYSIVLGLYCRRIFVKL